MNKARRILVAHPWMGRGGSEATAMWTLQALAESPDEFEVTLVTASAVVWDELNARYGTSLDGSQIRVIRSGRLPFTKRPDELAYLQRAYFERHCYTLSRDFDLCISAYNPIYFQKPGIQLIGDFSFSEPMRKRLRSWPGQPRLHRDSFLRRLYLRLVGWIRVSAPPLAERCDLVVANSAWTATLLEEYFWIDRAPVLWPPVELGALPEETNRDPWRFACLGRISPEKEIERVIRILAAVRKQGYPVTLELIGGFDESAYAQSILALASDHEWINQAGYLDGEAKRALLATCSFGIHACRMEAFGIAVAEMAAHGCVVVIPDSGGAREIVTMAELQFGCETEAVTRIVALFQNPSRCLDLRSGLQVGVSKMGGSRFSGELLKLVATHLATPNLPTEPFRRTFAPKSLEPSRMETRFYEWIGRLRRQPDSPMIRRFKNIATPRRVAVVIAHPDDEVFCSGLICELVERGSEVSIVCLTRGEGGPSGGHLREEVGRIRSEEMAAAAAVLGVRSTLFLGQIDPEPVAGKVLAPAIRVAPLSALLKPHLADADLVITHGSSGEYWHPAHRLLHLAVRRFSRERDGSAKVWLSFLARHPGHPISKLVNWDDPAYLRLDVSQHHVTRVEALARYHTQAEVFERFGSGSLEQFIRLTEIESYALMGTRRLQIAKTTDVSKRQRDQTADARKKDSQGEMIGHDRR